MTLTIFNLGDPKTAGSRSAIRSVEGQERAVSEETHQNELEDATVLQRRGGHAVSLGEETRWIIPDVPRTCESNFDDVQQLGRECCSRAYHPFPGVSALRTPGMDQPARGLDPIYC
ncbi:hypothetical protein CHS0354_041872 [Potamilus streckersoni]|uniref:Uncharacterized protein n=1 Tax=Potamilus streckersoni TaxID=2493646 RepID=A0AAE0STT8_9BIVA|nr:hypothetical protein CHS0354_041872 [Potamilus streckersoni]